jgi:mono/diheme cytochrome c family protein
MTAVMRIVAILLILLVAASLFGIYRIASVLPVPSIAPEIATRQADPEHGRKVALLGDCAGCHTARDGDDLAGGVPFATPVGTLYSSNITPDPAQGIGTYSFTDFVRLMRLGVTPTGKRIYPAMPYPAYAKVSDEDLQDLFAYLQTDIAPNPSPSRKADISWPLTMRWPLALWNLAYDKAKPFQPEPARDAEWNRGAYLVQGLAHCGTCHTPRNFAFAEKDLDGSTAFFLSGSSFDGGAPINLRGNDGDGLGRWSKQDIVQLLKSGRNPHSAVSGAMVEVVSFSTQYLEDRDISAIAAYLKTLGPAPGDRPTFTPDPSSLQTYLDGTQNDPGGKIFMDSCSACHRLGGQGAGTAFPGLAGNPMVLSRDPASLIAVILTGSRLPSTASAPSNLAMPGFAWRYDDSDVAALATFVRSAWGNHAPPVTPGQVTDARARLQHS